MFGTMEKTLKKLQISRQTYDENSFSLAICGGLCEWRRWYSFVFASIMVFGIVAGSIFSVIVLSSNYERFLDNIHDIAIVLNMLTQAVAFHFRQDEYLELFRAIDRDFFDYKETLDEVTKSEVEQVKSLKKSRKKIFGTYYKHLVAVTTGFQLLKKPVTNLIIGEKEGEEGDNLVWESPFGVFMPYKDYWIVYLIGFISGNLCTFLTLITVMVSVIQYQCLSEELLAELQIVKKTLTRCVERGEHLFKSRQNMKNAEEGQLTINDCILHCINHSVKHHQHTLRMMNVFKKLMFFPLFALIFDGGFILCMSSYMLINNDLSITLRVPMPCVIAAEATFAFIFCYYGGLLAEANEDVGNGIYDCEKWMYYSKVTSPYAIIIKGYCNIPNELSAGGFTSVNQRAFGSILSATYSYIGFMLST